MDRYIFIYICTVYYMQSSQVYSFVSLSIGNMKYPSCVHTIRRSTSQLRYVSTAPLVIFARPSWPKRHEHEMHVILLSHASVNVPCKKYQRVLHADFEWLDNELGYCWWKKSCTTWDVKNSVNHGINYLSTGAGFLPWYWRNGGWLLQFRSRPLMLTHVASWCYVLSTRAILWVWFWLSCFSSNKTQFVLFGDAFGDVQDLPSWELTYPTAKVLLKMVFPFPRWDIALSPGGIP